MQSNGKHYRLSTLDDVAVVQLHIKKKTHTQMLKCCPAVCDIAFQRFALIFVFFSEHNKSRARAPESNNIYL